MDSDLQVVKGISFKTGQLMEWVKRNRLGAGGFANVYLASVTKPVPRLVAVKYSSSPSPSLQKEYSVLQRFIDCPNIVQCYVEIITIEDGEANPNLLLEYADGEAIY
ncbi:mitogen-activated protein kinase kinase kinase 21 [Hibiscus trionum]|uniref:Mitogen-activated protein kinase kinase kinase 21 n=1 Tax=Hibiscus trionum TaxID=183268 RepID=A0A9W7HQD5_HIBTR|nr:mitogen-activated protein kinase kinase kinase 21 [Hibiscus trionum]